MEQKDKELLIKDLCGRLPYEPWIWFKENWETNPNFKGCQSQLRLYHLEYIVKDMDITLKPYLRPMSSMTGDEMREIEQMNNNSIQHIDTIGVRFQAFYDTCYNEMYDLFDYLNTHHFDYRGLIEKGLALAAPEGMYNN